MVGKGRVGALGLLVWIVVVAGVPATAPAQDPETLFGAGTNRAGKIDLLAIGPPGTQVTITEEIDGRQVPVGTLQLDPFAFTEANWSCDRLERNFVATFVLPDGRTESSSYAIRTPSCRKRLAVELPGIVRRGEAARVTVADRWQLGDLRVQLCRAPAGRRLRCSPLVLPPGELRATRLLRFDRPGRWKVELRFAGSRHSRTVLVDRSRRFVLRGRQPPLDLLVTGDSMAWSLDSVLDDKLARTARIDSDVRPATGVSKPGSNWIGHARRQARRRRDATVVFLGAGDGFDMTTPGRETVVCCGEPWIAEYGRRVLEMMRLYLRGGISPVIWLTIPAPRDQKLAPSSAAVNEAIRGAAAEAPGVEVVPVDEILTPGFRYSNTIRHRGRVRLVRNPDGVHLAPAGGSIIANLVTRQLRRLDLL